MDRIIVRNEKEEDVLDKMSDTIVAGMTALGDNGEKGAYSMFVGSEKNITIVMLGIMDSWSKVLDDDKRHAIGFAFLAAVENMFLKDVDRTDITFDKESGIDPV